MSQKVVYQMQWNNTDCSGEPYQIFFGKEEGCIRSSRYYCINNGTNIREDTYTLDLINDACPGGVISSTVRDIDTCAFGSKYFCRDEYFSDEISNAVTQTFYPNIGCNGDLKYGFIFNVDFCVDNTVYSRDENCTQVFIQDYNATDPFCARDVTNSNDFNVGCTSTAAWECGVPDLSVPVTTQVIETTTTFLETTTTYLDTTTYVDTTTDVTTDSITDLNLTTATDTTSVSSVEQESSTILETTNDITGVDTTTDDAAADDDDAAADDDDAAADDDDAAADDDDAADDGSAPPDAIQSICNTAVEIVGDIDCNIVLIVGPGALVLIIGILLLILCSCCTGASAQQAMNPEVGLDTDSGEYSSVSSFSKSYGDFSS